MSKNTKLISLLLVLFTLKRFSIKLIQDLRESYKYKHSKIKKSYKYENFGVEKPYKYKYFKTEKLYEYGYLIVKKLDKNIESRHSFGYFVIMNKLLKI